jgi:hypothetical protein
MPFQVQDRCKKTSIRFLYSTSERLRRSRFTGVKNAYATGRELRVIVESESF